MSLRLSLATLVAVVAAPTLATAQSASPYYQPAPGPAPAAAPAPAPAATPPPAIHAARPALEPRVGLELDIGLQAGELNCSSDGEQCDGFVEAGGIDLGATYMFTPRLGVNAQVWAMGHSRDGWTLTQVITTVGVEFRPLPILSLQAGVGHAHVGLSYDHGDLSVTSDNAFAIMLGASFDIIRARRWVIDLQAKFGQGFYGDADDDGDADVVARNVGAGAGFTFLF
jgi:hypothetical protein